MSKKDKQHPPIPDGATAAVDETPVLRAELERLKSSADMVQRQNEGLSAQVSALQRTIQGLTSDLMVLEQTAAGRAPNIALQTELGKSAAHALGEVLKALDKQKSQGQEGDALPATGWSSHRAKELVEAVRPQPGMRASDVRALLLGDLLAQLAPHVGETGANETASDTLKRKLGEDILAMKASLEAARSGGELLLKEYEATRQRMLTLQSAMVARRAPDAGAGAVLERLAGVFLMAGHPISTDEGLVAVAQKIVNEWMGLRSFLSPAPLTALAIRTDATPATPERYTVLLLEWDGKALKVDTFEKGEPWQDVAPRMRQLVDIALVPAPFRSRG